ncbi:CDGSH iron-sulfur domain-containing protein [Actinoplanes sp. NPDC024001]|uniref:CDGSH iron-sulfur domain-containing protein n=1 Tax=Actinoplanes sp. NPDC024001 TaxID=3154598 RepID=UPI0033FB6FB6
MSASIVPYEDGPLIVRGDFELHTPDGEPIDPGRGTIALCRCGRSATKPFCDGTHKAVRFRAPSDRQTPSPRKP